MNYETNAFGMDIIMAVISEEDPSIYFEKENPIHPKGSVSQGFLKNVMDKHQEKQYFLNTFYDISLPSYYPDEDKICRIKDLSDESIQIKKIEEEEEF